MSEELTDDTNALAEEAERVFAAKRAWHAQQAKLPLKAKVAILLKMQKDDYPTCTRQSARTGKSLEFEAVVC